MSFQKKELFGYFFRAVFACVLFLVFAAITIFLVQNRGALLYVFLFAALLIGQTYLAYKSIAQLLRKASEYRHAKESGFLDSLTRINAYQSDEDMQRAFQTQRENYIYCDDTFIITEDFFANTLENQLFLLNGILDAETTVHRHNGSIEKIIFSLIYFDGKRYTTTFRREFQDESLWTVANRTNRVTKIIEDNSANFRKHLPET